MHASTGTSNYYAPLTFTDSSIAVDSGASDGFGNVDTPGTDRRSTKYGITMASATGHIRSSVGTDKFDLPLPEQCLDYHVFKRGDIQRPLLSVGKACDAGCTVLFDQHKCTFTRTGKTLLNGFRDTHTGLYLIPEQQGTQQRAGQPTNVPILRQHQALSAYAVQSIP